MHALHIFMFSIFAIAVVLFVDALPYEQRKVHTIPLKMKSITRRKAYNVSRRAITRTTLNQDPPDVAYFGEVTFGTGTPQEFNIQFDTGSADFFAVYKDCDSPACKNKLKYDPHYDSSFKEIERPFHVEYPNNGFAKGSSGTTTIQFGSLSVETQYFGLADTISDDFTDVTFVGIMGMGFSSASENGQLLPITNLINSKAIDQPQFSFMLGRDADKTSGELTIGGSNLDRYNFNSLIWTYLVDSNHWLIPLEDCFVNGQPLDFQGRTGLIDTGTTRIIAPPGDAKTFYDKVPNAKAQDDGTFLIPCDSNVVVGLKFNGITWNMDNRDFVIKVNANVCIGSIEGSDTGSDTEWHIGAAFLKNVYTIFDQGNLRIGFASLRQS